MPCNLKPTWANPALFSQLGCQTGRLLLTQIRKPIVSVDDQVYRARVIYSAQAEKSFYFTYFNKITIHNKTIGKSMEIIM